MAFSAFLCLLTTARRKPAGTIDRSQWFCGLAEAESLLRRAELSILAQRLEKPPESVLLCAVLVSFLCHKYAPGFG
jgi:hypothetical protein